MINLLVKENIHIKGRFYRLIFQCEELASQAKPGHFLHIKVNDSIQPLLRRPFCVNRVRKSHVEILFEVVGEGTEILSRTKAGETLSAYGPLGNGFSENISGKKALLVAGGIGVAPLLFLGESLLAKQFQVEVLLGFQTHQDVIAEADFAQLGVKPEITTDDGSYGRKGLVTDLLKNKLDKNAHVFACGPVPMLKSVSEHCIADDVPCEVSIHNYMACGLGVCLGCVFPTKNGYKKVCEDGPVFNAIDLIFE